MTLGLQRFPDFHEFRQLQSSGSLQWLPDQRKGVDPVVWQRRRRSVDLFEEWFDFGMLMKVNRMEGGDDVV